MTEGRRINTLVDYNKYCNSEPNYFEIKLRERVVSDKQLVDSGAWSQEELWNNVMGNSLALTIRLIGIGEAGIEILNEIVGEIEKVFIELDLPEFNGVRGLMDRDPYAKDSIKKAFAKSGQVFQLPSENNNTGT